MEEITLQQLLEAGCHFGHKAERWYPAAGEFIYTKKDGVHIIDLAKTKAGLEAAAQFIRDTVSTGGEVLFVATKRQARGIVTEAAQKAGAPYFTQRWIGGFMTNWDAIKKNIEKVLKMVSEREIGAWKVFPKHEQVKLAHHLEKLQSYYGGVLTVKRVPQAVFVVDVRKELAAVREAIRVNIPVIGIVDTNSDPRDIQYVIPANDDAVGSVSAIMGFMMQAYTEGKKIRDDSIMQEKQNAEKIKEEMIKKVEPKKQEEVKVVEEKKPEKKVIKSKKK